MNIFNFKIEMEQKADAAGQTEATFEGFASVYDNVDAYGDVVKPGAFSRTLNAKSSVPLLWQHDSTCPIGTANLEDSPAGLKIKGTIDLAVEKGREAYSLLKKKAIEGLSIGYNTVKDSYEDGKRLLQEVKLWEVSVVTFPANELATVTAVKNPNLEKSFDDGLAGIVGNVATIKALKSKSFNPEIVKAAIESLETLLPAPEATPNPASRHSGKSAEQGEPAEDGYSDIRKALEGLRQSISQ